jgi:hypothetical protein
MYFYDGFGIQPTPDSVVDRILSFLPRFEQPGFAFGTWDEANQTLEIPAEVSKFCRVCGFLYQYIDHYRDRCARGRERVEHDVFLELHNQPHKVAESTDLFDLCALLMMEVRTADRCHPTVLLDFLKSDFFLALLRRIAVLRRAQLAEDGQAGPVTASDSEANQPSPPVRSPGLFGG